MGARVAVAVVLAVVKLAGNLGRHNYGNQKFHATHAHPRVKNPRKDTHTKKRPTLGAN